MGIQTRVRPTHVEPIPETRAPVLRTMLSVAMLVEGYLDTDPGHLDPSLRNCHLLPQARLLLAGSLCRRPLVAREFADVCGVSGYDGILTRLGGDPSSPTVTFDVHQANEGATHWAYRLWIGVPTGQSWLVPSAGEQMFIRFDPFGLEFTNRAPFVDVADRARGLRSGNDYLSIATKGWF